MNANSKLIAFLRLMRPANIVTAMADIFAGFGIAALPLLYTNSIPLNDALFSLGLLLLATIGLYGGGVVMNDVCDAELDRVERPERPIPKGIVSKTSAAILGLGLLLFGVIAAFFVSIVSCTIAIAIAILCLTYDAYTKPHLWAGPINMGLCRSLNLLLGISIVSAYLTTYWMLFFIPLVFIAGVTFISKGEVYGGNKKILFIALFLYLFTIAAVCSLTLFESFHFLHALPFFLIFIYLTLTTLFKAIQSLDPLTLRKAVKTGILCIIILDATLAAGFAGWWYGLLILVLLPLSIILNKKFAIT